MIWLIVAAGVMGAIFLFFTVLSIQTAMHRRDKTGRGCGCHNGSNRAGGES